MSMTSRIIAGALATFVVAAGAGAAFAQSANGGGNGGSNSGSSGGGSTVVPATFSAVVPDNQRQRPRQEAFRNDGSGCPTPMEGRRGPRLVNSCGPE